MDAAGSFVQSMFAGAGLTTPNLRFLAVLSGGTLLEYLLKPSYAFDESGALRTWAMPLSKDVPPGATYTPIGFFPLLGALVAHLFF